MEWMIPLSGLLRMGGSGSQQHNYCFTSFFLQQNVLGNVICKMLTILSQPQLVSICFNLVRLLCPSGHSSWPHREAAASNASWTPCHLTTIRSDPLWFTSAATWQDGCENKEGLSNRGTAAGSCCMGTCWLTTTTHLITRNWGNSCFLVTSSLNIHTILRSPTSSCLKSNQVCHMTSLMISQHWFTVQVMAWCHQHSSK